MMFRLSIWVRNADNMETCLEQLTSRNKKCSVKLSVAGNEIKVDEVAYVSCA